MKNETQATVPQKTIVEPERPGYTVRPDGSILLVKPRLELHGDIQHDLSNINTLTRRWFPERALIVGAVVIIEEWGLIVPLSYVHVSRFDAQKEKVS